jgi:hypothetical protein
MLFVSSHYLQLPFHPEAKRAQFPVETHTGS